MVERERGGDSTTQEVLVLLLFLLFLLLLLLDDLLSNSHEVPTVCTHVSHISLPPTAKINTQSIKVVRGVWNCIIEKA